MHWQRRPLLSALGTTLPPASGRLPSRLRPLARLVRCSVARPLHYPARGRRMISTLMAPRCQRDADFSWRTTPPVRCHHDASVQRLGNEPVDANCDANGGEQRRMAATNDVCYL